MNVDLHSPFKDKTVLITGGTGSFGQFLVRDLLDRHEPRKIIVYSRDEAKHAKMATWVPDDRILNFFLGDVRDVERLRLSMAAKVDIVVHAAALKRVDSIEYNPIEAIQTNIMGSINVMKAAIDCGVSKLIFLSTDKACEPVNLYGVTKLAMEKVMIQGNAYASNKKTSIFGCRYGNVFGSRGSVIHTFTDCLVRGLSVPVTDFRMTRFWMTLREAVDLVTYTLEYARAGEIFIPKLPALKILDLAVALSTLLDVEVTTKSTGIRPGEKLYEKLVSENEGRSVTRYGDGYIMHPHFNFWGGEPRGMKVLNTKPWDSRTTVQLSLKEILAKLKEMQGTWMDWRQDNGNA